MADDGSLSRLARWLQNKGIAAFVLKYRVMEKRGESIPVGMNPKVHRSLTVTVLPAVPRFPPSCFGAQSGSTARPGKVKPILGLFSQPPGGEGAILATNGSWVLAATILGSSMAFIDGTVVNVALPALQSALHATLADVQWVVESYALFLAALLLIGGSLGDLYGRRKIFAAGVVIFSASLGLVRTRAQHRAAYCCQGLQGIGGALLVPGSLALISANFSEKERGRAIGTWSGFTSITAAIGPVLGGWFIEHGSWRWVFFINVPLGLAVLLLALWKVPESRAGNRSQQFDWPGGLLAALGFGGIVFALIESTPAAARWAPSP